MPLIQAKQNLKNAVKSVNTPYVLRKWGKKFLALTKIDVDEEQTDIDLFTYITDSLTSGYSGKPQQNQKFNPKYFNDILRPQAQNCRHARMLLGFSIISGVMGVVILGLAAAGVLASGFMFFFPLLGLCFGLALLNTNFKAARWGGGALEAVELLREMDDESSPVGKALRVKHAEGVRSRSKHEDSSAKFELETNNQELHEKKMALEKKIKSINHEIGSVKEETQLILKEKAEQEKAEQEKNENDDIEIVFLQNVDSNGKEKEFHLPLFPAGEPTNEEQPIVTSNILSNG